MKNTWALLTMLNSVAIVVVMLYHANRMNGNAPWHVRACVSLMAAGAGLYAYMAMIGSWFSWPDVVFSAAALSYVLFNRRRPT